MNKPSTKSKKSTQPTAADLEAIRLAMKFDKRGMAAILGLPYRTYQDYAYSKRRVPVAVLAAAKAAQSKDRAVMTTIIKNLERDLDRRHPAGIPSDE